MGRNNNDFSDGFRNGMAPVTFKMSSKDGSWKGSHTFMASSGEHARAQAEATGYNVDDEGRMG